MHILPNSLVMLVTHVLTATIIAICTSLILLAAYLSSGLALRSKLLLRCLSLSFICHYVYVSFFQTFSGPLKFSDPCPIGREFTTLTPLIDPCTVGYMPGELLLYISMKNWCYIVCMQKDVVPHHARECCCYGER